MIKNTPKKKWTVMRSALCCLAIFLCSCGASVKHVHIKQPRADRAIINDKECTGNCTLKVDICSLYVLKTVNKSSYIKYYYINSCNFIKDTTIFTN